MATRPCATDDDLITTEEVLDRLEVHPSLRPIVASCILPAKRVNDVVYFRRADLEAWIRRQLGTDRA